jgi:hypothetical protein
VSLKTVIIAYTQTLLNIAMHVLVLMFSHKILNKKCIFDQERRLKLHNMNPELTDESPALQLDLSDLRNLSDVIDLSANASILY